MHRDCTPSIAAQNEQKHMLGDWIVVNRANTILFYTLLKLPNKTPLSIPHSTLFMSSQFTSGMEKAIHGQRLDTFILEFQHIHH